jgi:hypothetical protein
VYIPSFTYATFLAQKITKIKFHSYSPILKNVSFQKKYIEQLMSRVLTGKKMVMLALAVKEIKDLH